MATIDARNYRTLLTQQAAQGPNFAGHYAIVTIGCGAGASCYAIVDSVSGAVFFPANLRSVADLPYDFADSHERLTYRNDSRLLAAFGAPNEEKMRSGLSLFEWTGRSLKLRRFVPLSDLCDERESWSKDR